MTDIICATRGGEGSRAVQYAAIKRALETGNQLIFLYVIDSEGLGKLDDLMQPAVRVELFWMGNTLLRIAEHRAQAANLTAELAIREGPIRQEICDFVVSKNASLLLLGAPRHLTVNIFQENEIGQFAQYIHQLTGVSVEIIRPEDVQIPQRSQDRKG
jgi:nucleotide-binding universal stress UspA family protein